MRPFVVTRMEPHWCRLKGGRLDRIKGGVGARRLEPIGVFASRVFRCPNCRMALDRSRRDRQARVVARRFIRGPVG